MTGAGAVALAETAAIPGTVVHRVAPAGADGRMRFGILREAEGRRRGEEGREQWKATKVVMSRSARRLMEGWVRVPAD